MNSRSGAGRARRLQYKVVWVIVDCCTCSKSAANLSFRLKCRLGPAAAGLPDEPSFPRLPRRGGLDEISRAIAPASSTDTAHPAQLSAFTAIWQPKEQRQNGGGPLRMVRLYAYRRICQYTNVPTQYFAATPVSLVTWMALGAGPSSIASDWILTLGLLPILVGAGYGEAISGKSEPHWKVLVCDPRNARIAEQFVKRDSTGHEGTEVILMAFKGKALTRYQSSVRTCSAMDSYGGGLATSVCKTYRNKLSGLVKRAISWPRENVSGLFQSPFGVEL